MDIRPIRTDDDHRDAVNEIERLWGAEPGTRAGDKLDILATLVEAYEAKRWSIDPAAPLDVLWAAITDDGRSQADLAAVLGSRSKVSQILNGKGPITLEAARKISRAWKIPIQLLVATRDQAALTILSEHRCLAGT